MVAVEMARRREMILRQNWQFVLMDEIWEEKEEK